MFTSFTDGVVVQLFIVQLLYTPKIRLGEWLPGFESKNTMFDTKYSLMCIPLFQDVKFSP